MSGAFALAEFPRLADEVSGLVEGSAMAFELQGYRVDDASFIGIRARAEFLMTCQRCLEDVACVVEVESRLLLVPPGEALPDEDLEDDDFDPVHVWRDFDVTGAVEEELLLALPLAPTHDNCEMPAARERDGENSPFAVLKGLKAPGGRNK